MVVREVRFTRAERARLAEQCQALGITFGEFVRHATLQSLDEMEGLTRDVQRKGSDHVPVNPN